MHSLKQSLQEETYRQRSGRLVRQNYDTGFLVFFYFCLFLTQPLFSALDLNPKDPNMKLFSKPSSHFFKNLECQASSLTPRRRGSLFWQAVGNPPVGVQSRASGGVNSPGTRHTGQALEENSQASWYTGRLLALQGVDAGCPGQRRGREGWREEGHLHVSPRLCRNADSCGFAQQLPSRQQEHKQEEN